MEKKTRFDLLVVRLTSDEQERYEKIYSRARERNVLASPTDVNRELLGMAEYGLLTEEDKDYFRGITNAPRRLKANQPKEDAGNDYAIPPAAKKKRRKT